ARHHFCIFDARSRGIFTGDTFGSAYPPLKRLTRGLIPTTTPVHFDPVALPHSINRLLELDPEKAYLTHYGELVNPKAHGESLKQWIAQFVDLCEAISPGPDDPIDELQTALGQMIVNELQSEMDPNDIQTLLSIDIKLNAQGILHWWHHNRHV
ncbi:MAG: MBL fold metallo-hydrolase, partial [Pseudomonadota bacterium]